MVIPLRSGRQNHPLGLGECRRQGRAPPVLRRDPRAATTAAPLRHRAGGAGSRTSKYPRTTTLPLGSQQNASPFCDHLRCRVCARRIRNLPAGTDNRLVAGSSPPSPTTQSCANPEFPVSAEYPRFSAVWGECNRPFAVSAGNEDRPEADWGPSSLASQIRFPVRGEGPGQRLGSLRQRPVCMQEIRGPSALQTDADRGLKLPPPAAYGIREGISERLQVVTPDLIGCGGRPHWSGERPFQLTDEARSIVALIDELESHSASD